MIRLIFNDKNRVGSWVASKIGRETLWDGFEAIGIEKNGQIVGGCIVEGYTKNARCFMHIAGEGNWLVRGFLDACFAYVFGQLKCKVAIGMVGSNNEKALRFDRHIGFRDVATIKDGYEDGVDLVILEMRPEFCRWIKDVKNETL